MAEFAKFFDRFQSTEKSLCDTVCVFILRKSDKKIGLMNDDNIGWWLPFKTVDQQKTWNSVIKEILEVYLISIKVFNAFIIVYIINSLA